MNERRKKNGYSSEPILDDWPEKKLQKLMNQFGFRDDRGNALAEDGIMGPKSTQALKKTNDYQQQLVQPDIGVKEWQEQLNDWGYKDAGVISGSSMGG